MIFALIRMQIKSAMEYKTSSILQIGFMLANNIFMFCVWLVIFNKFKELNGWSLQNIMYLQAIVAFSYSFSMIFFGGITEISRHVNQNTFDTFLMQPRNILAFCLLSKIHFFALGDFLYGLGLFFLTGASFYEFLGFVVLALISAVIITSFQLIAQSLSFFWGDVDAFASQARSSIVTLSLYPAFIYKGVSKFVVYFILPAAFVSFLPVEIFIHFSWICFAQLLAYLFMISFFSIWFFYTGIKRYESGSTITHFQ